MRTSENASALIPSLHMLRKEKVGSGLSASYPTSQKPSNVSIMIELEVVTISPSDLVPPPG